MLKIEMFGNFISFRCQFETFFIQETAFISSTNSSLVAVFHHSNPRSQTKISQIAQNR